MGLLYMSGIQMDKTHSSTLHYTLVFLLCYLGILFLNLSFFHNMLSTSMLSHWNAQLFVALFVSYSFAVETWEISLDRSLYFLLCFLPLCLPSLLVDFLPIFGFVKFSLIDEMPNDVSRFFQFLLTSLYKGVELSGIW